MDEQTFWHLAGQVGRAAADVDRLADELSDHDTAAQRGTAAGGGPR